MNSIPDCRAVCSIVVGSPVVRVYPGFSEILMKGVTMKIKIYLPVVVIAFITCIFPIPASASVDEDPGRVQLVAAQQKQQKLFSSTPLAGAILNPENGSIAWAHNVWTYEIYQFDTETPTEFTVTDTVDFQAFTGDFAPDDAQHLWLIQFPENRLLTYNIVTGVTTFVSELPVPLAEGVWTSLAVDKTSGAYFAIATDGIESVIYSVDPATGATTALFGLGLQAVISSAFDASGNLYIFDIESDSTFVVDIPASVITPLGPAGFDGNFAQGMGFDPIGDEVYLAAYDNDQGPQLRRLNRTTGETELLASLPGETGVFGFPSGFAEPQASVGPDATICEDQVFTTSNATASNYILLEWSSSGDGTFENQGQLMATYYPGGADTANGSVELCLTATGFNGDITATDCLLLTLAALPEADAGPDATVAYGDSFTTSNAAAESFSALVWSSSGDGTFDDAGALLTSYAPGPSDIDAGLAELCLLAEPVDPCTSSAASCMVLTINQIPQGMDFGDAPEASGIPLTFPTTLAQNGAAHAIDPAIFLGNKIDGEIDGQPDAAALGDDNDLLYPSLGDDEDGVELPQAIFQGSQVSISVVASVDGYLDTWIDYNQDQSWFSPDEHIISMAPVASGSNQLSFVVPPAASPGQSFIRFRFRDFPQPLEAGGFAYNGEVEDYSIEIKEAQLEEMDFGDAPGINGVSYPTLFSHDGARHIIVEGIHLGAAVDAEPDGQPYAAAAGDDNDIYFPSQGDDEDGVLLPESVQKGSETEIQILASVDGFLDAWMDFNQDGAWSDEEHIFNTLTLLAGQNVVQFSVPADAATGNSFLRFRFRDYNEPLTPYGLAENGEVEDYFIQVTGEPPLQYDFGDAPGLMGLFAYPTLIDDDGARHQIVPGIHLGQSVDAEPNGQPAPDAMGDDADLYYPSGGDDEDGVQFQGPLVPGALANITVTASTDGFLEAWADFNRDGDWNDDTEHIFSSHALVAGINTLAFDVPANAEAGNSFARFRFSDYDAKPGTGGTAENGEVEDYMILIQESAQGSLDFGDAPGSDFPVLLADNGARHVIDGITFLGTSIDGEEDGLPSGNAKGDDNDNLDDEEGVVFLNRFFTGSSAYLQISASMEGFLNAWADFNGNGSWADDGEHIFLNQELTEGNNELEIDIPESANTGNSFLRFRFSSESGLSFSGLAPNGEVEDYGVVIYPSWSSTPTPITHIIMIPIDLPVLNSGDMLAVFHTDDGILTPAGNLVYASGQPGQLIAFGDDPSTPEVKEGFEPGEPFTWKLFDAGSNEIHDIQVEYDPQFPNHDGTFQPLGLSALTGIQYEEDPCPLPAGWEFTVTGSLHTVNVPVEASPSVLGENVASGDWIGAFYKDDNGNDVCGGSGQWLNTSGVVINLYGDDPFTGEKDGFAPGETITWKIYRCSDGQTFEAVASYNTAFPCQGQFGSFCLAELTSLEGMYFRNFPLNQGWNSISSFLVPYDPDVENMFANYNDDLVIINNLTSLYWPNIGVNTIGDWDNYSGYAIKVETDVIFKIGGESFAENEITLDAGWHYLPVLSDCPVNAVEIFEPIEDQLTVVQDLIGTKVWWPDQGVYTLQVLVPGKAYKIRLTDEATIMFPDCGPIANMKNHPTGTESMNDFRHSMTPYSHAVAIHEQVFRSLPPNQILGAFDANGNLYGSLKIVHDGKNHAMIVQGDDPITPVKEGFADGEEMIFGLLDATGDMLKELDVAFDNVYGFARKFHDNGLSVVKAVANTSVQQQSIPVKVAVFPNPSTGNFTISGLEPDAEIEIFDAFGKVLRDVQVSAEGNIDLSGKPAGIYYVKVATGTTPIYKKLILR